MTLKNISNLLITEGVINLKRYLKKYEWVILLIIKQKTKNLKMM